MRDAIATIRAAAGDELVERLLHLDRRRREPQALVFPAGPAIAPGDRTDFDVVFLGGGLSLLHAPMLADLGCSVAVFDRARVGAAHREWNAGRAEITALRSTSIGAELAIDELVVKTYRAGTCRWHGGGDYPVRGVLDHAIDAGRLLARTRAIAERRGVALFDRASAIVHRDDPGGVRVIVREGDVDREVTARVVVDARGASSPYARADLICPTVGGVLRGLREGADRRSIDPDVGEILATTEGVDDGRQHLWEAFPGAPGETTTYLFYYAAADEVGPGALTALYARFFDRMSTYKQGAYELVRPTFGFIPGWSRLAPRPAPPGPRWVLTGDAAALHSPLTFCGFGGTTRALVDTCRRIAALVRGEPAPAIDDPFVHTGAGALAWMLARPARDPRRKDDLNALLDAAFATLSDQGEAYPRLLRDEMGAREFVSFLRETARRRPRVYADVLSTLDPSSLARWSLALGRAFVRG